MPTHHLNGFMIVNHTDQFEGFAAKNPDFTIYAANNKTGLSKLSRKIAYYNKQF
jgi:hypothetical protein